MLLFSALTLVLAAQADVRLDPGVVPTRYAMTLSVDPAQPVFKGGVDISIRLQKPARQLVLHGRDLQVKKATVAGGRRKAVALKVTVEGAEADMLRLEAPAELPAGDHVLHVEWEGRTDRAPLQGLYAFKHQGDAYVATQFEATDARRMAPCFDEPGFKAPFLLTLEVPSTLVAVSNGAVVKEVVKGNRKTVFFRETRPLPTYLWAVLVGPFDVVDAGASNGIPNRVLVPRGSAALASYAARMAVPVQKFLEDYFGMPLAYGKLDHVVLTEFGSGGMENAGAITYREEALLVDEPRASVAHKRRILGLMAHEVAHQWFGDLVTMKWWDDLWLNEAFASWMGAKVVDALAPELEQPMEAAGYLRYGMEVDALPSTHAVHTPVESAARADEVFDTITYVKGGFVLGMVEKWLGKDAFRDGVRAYMKRHADGNATGEDLYAALATAAQNTSVVPVMQAWFNEKHHPLVEASLLCDGRPRVHVDMKRYALGGPEPAEGIRATPVCIRHPAGTDTKTTCLVVEGAVDIPVGDTCPAWVMPNAGSAGFYAWTLPPDRMEALAAAPLTDVERVNLLDAAWTAVRLGKLPLASLARILDRAAADPSRHVAGRVAERWLSWREQLARDEDVPAINAHVADLFRARATAAGWKAADGENEATREARMMLLGTMLGAEDPAFMDEAQKRADAWLQDPASVSPDVARVAVPAAASRLTAESQRARVERLAAGGLAPDVRVALIASLSASRDPAVAREGLGHLASPWLRDQDAYTLMYPAFRDRRARPVGWAWLSSHWDVITARLDQDHRMSLPTLMMGACSEEERKAVADFYADPVHALRGTGARLKETLARVDACVGNRQRLGPELAAVVASWKAPPAAPAPPVKADAQKGSRRKGAK